MINNEKFNGFIEKLNNLEESFLTHISQKTTETLCSVGLITEETDVTKMSKEQLLLTHTLLHMFSEGKNGRGLSKKTIEKLHKEVVGKLNNHICYDKLDKGL